MTDLFVCERKGCGHPMNRHNPCNGIVGRGKKAHPCTCPAFQPEDQRLRVASLTDVQLRQPDEQAAEEARLRAAIAAGEVTA